MATSRRSTSNDKSEDTNAVGAGCSVQESEVKITWKPKNWEQHLANIRLMRSSNAAPVDSIGASCLMDKSASAQTQRYQILLSLMLSSQTKDGVTAAAMKRLVDHGCAIQKILDTEDSVLGQLIYPVSFWKKKVVYIKKATAILDSKFDGDVPNAYDDVISLPGIGPKMGHLIMLIAWGQTTGIAVDTHVHRICNRLKWVKKPTKTPNETESSIEEWIPREHWNEVNKLFVGFGQTTCLAVKPKCEECLNSKICTFGKSKKKLQK